MKNTEIKAPEDTIKPNLDLTEIDGNAFSIIGHVTQALYNAGNGQHIVDAFQRQAMESDYNHLLLVAMEFTDAPDDE